MSGSLNKVQLIGRCAGAPETRHLQDGTPIVHLTIVTNETWKDKGTGEKRERAEFNRVVIFNEGLGRVAAEWLTKGSRCFVEGALRTRKYTDRDGNERSTTEVILAKFRGELVLLDTKSRDETANYGHAASDEAPF